MKSSWKAWIFLFSLSLILIVGGRIIADRQGLMAGFLLALSINSILYFWSDQILLSLFQVEEVEGQDPWGLRELITPFAMKLRIKKPRIYILPCEAPSAFALGRSPNHGAIILTEGLLKRFDAEDIKAVLAYQIEAIARQETLLPAFVITLFGGSLVLGLARMLDRGLGWTPFFAAHKSNWATRTFLPFVFLLFRFSLSQNTYYELDQKAAEMISDPHRVANLLWKLESYSSSMGLDIPPPTAPLFMVNPLTKSSWASYFRLQPPTENRIRKLVGYYPI